MVATLDQLKRDYYASLLGLTAQQEAAMSVSDLETQFFTNPPASGGGKYTNDLIGNRPTPAVYGVGWYFANDQNGGTLYYSNGTTWQQTSPGINWASGTQLAYAPDSTFNTAITGIGAANAVDLSALLRVTIPASNVPVKIRAKIFGSAATGTAGAVGDFFEPIVELTDNANTLIDMDALPVWRAATGTNRTFYKTFSVETILPAPVAVGTYKVRGYLTAAAPTGMACNCYAGAGFPVGWIEAVAE